MTTTDVRYIRPDMCVAGGLTAGKKIAAEAEVRGVYIIPHNPLGPGIHCGLPAAGRLHSQL